MSYLYHISDTIQTSIDLEKNDTTVERIKITYEALKKKLWINWKIQEKFIGSEVWNSYETGVQAIIILKKYIHNLNCEVILVNNASRARFKNIEESKWSDCLWAQIEINNKTHHIIWVDDRLFSVFLPFLKIGTKIKKIEWLNWQTELWLKEIKDFSKWTQFRSKEYFPLVQLIFEKVKQDNYWEIDIEKLEKYLNITDYDYKEENLIIYKKELLHNLKYEDDVEIEYDLIIENMIEQEEKRLKFIFSDWGVVSDYKKNYIDWFKWIERIQLLGELFIFPEKYWFEFVKTSEDLWISENIIKKYFEIRKNLQKNQLCIIDRDKYWNSKCLYSDNINWSWIEDFTITNWFNLNDLVNIKDENWKLLFKAYLTKSLTSKTWENCIWQGSSKWFKWEGLLEINKSFDETYSVLQEIQKLPIGTIITIYE